jgi:hypothetical protein
VADEDQGRVAQAAQTAKTIKQVEEAAKVARTAALLFNPYTLIAIVVAAVVILLALLVGVAIAGVAGSGSKDKAPAEGGGSSGAVPGLADISDIEIKAAPCTSGSAAGGCYVLPSKTKYWEAYSSSLTGTKCLVQLIAATSKAWKEKYPEDVVHIGDLNAPGHASHQLGVDVDISTDRAANMTTAGYSQDRSVEYGKLWFSTKQIEYIFFNDAKVRGEVNGYAQSKGYPGVMQYWAGHEDHYHVRVTPDSHGECGNG